ncbi:MAG: N-6 DNA methylase, partial [Actinobacteria bacterium]|nr:N-6 DNA methylase [Actinomycetota bacterium]
ADILGQVYEQFLGKVIRLTAGHRAVVEDKPEVKKAGGVYYTPTYIVDYIVKHTVGRLLEGLTPKQAASLRILDPACGSGSFLIGAYQYLLDWHRDWYAADAQGGAKKHAKALYQGRGGEWRLTTAEKKRILQSCIYGVDIDAQAVETTKLSLLLKVLEGETAESIDAQLSFLRERALPDLSANNKCGNSLIGPDFYDDQQLGLAGLDEEERYRINVFDWEAEFPEILGKAVPEERRGFDAVIGNPPYIRMEQFKLLKTYLRAQYACHDERSDIYAYFMERGHKLLASCGRFGMIVSNKFLRAKYGTPLRRLLASSFHVEHVVDFAGLPVFRGATVRTLVFVSTRASVAARGTTYTPPPDGDRFARLVGGSSGVGDAADDHAYEVSLPADGEAWTFLPAATQALLARLGASCWSLANYSEGRIWMGVKSGLSEAFVIDDTTRQSLLAANPESAEVIKPFIVGRDVRRYRVDGGDKYLLYMFHGVDQAKYPAVLEHLEPFRAKLEKRATEQAWYELQQPQYRFSRHMDAPKIVFPDIAKGPRFALDVDGHYGSNTIYFIPLEDHYLLGLLNSSLSHFYFQSVCAGLEGGGEVYLRFFGQYMEGFPVPRVDDTDQQGAKARETLAQMAKAREQLEARLATARTPLDAENHRREAARIDDQIDRLVYDLYDLTDLEVALVEGSVLPA